MVTLNNSVIAIDLSEDVSRNLELDRIPWEVTGGARTWSERKLLRKFYRLRDLELGKVLS